MPLSSTAPIDPPTSAVRQAPLVAWRVALTAAAVALLIALVVDNWYRGHFQREERVRTRVAMTPYAAALRGAVERRVALLSGLRSFADSRPTRRALDLEFPTFAEGTIVGTSGVRALQFVERGRIISTWPIKGNEAALNYDLLADPRPVLSADVRRALASGLVTVTGPVRLVQGGEGLLVRQRIQPRAGFPDLAAIIIDVPTLIADAGLPDSGSTHRLEVRDRQMAWFGGDPVGSAMEPETLRVSVADGDWALLGAPAVGWRRAIQPRLNASRLTSAALIVVAALLGLVLGGREERLVREVVESGSRLDLALRAGRMGAWEWHIASGRVLWSEAAADIFGYQAAELDGNPGQFFNRVHPDDRRDLRKTFEEMMVGARRDFVAEYRVLLPDESLRWVLGIGELERDGDGRPIRMMGVVSDASERRELEERLRHAQRLEAVGTLAGGVAHDFNNLLTAIIGFTELANDRATELGEDRTAPAIRSDLAQVLMTAERAATLTGQLLAFSRRKTTEPTRIDLSEAVRELEPMLRRLLGGLSELRTDLMPGMVRVWVDHGQLTQVLLNLVVNARDAMPDGGNVTIRTFAMRGSSGQRPFDAPPGDWICLEVEDSGVGMAPELQARIFEPYFTTKDVGRGTGLGLAVVYGAVQNAGGVVTVRSAEGRGSVFRIYLPPKRTTDEHAIAEEALSAAQ